MKTLVLFSLVLSLTALRAQDLQTQSGPSTPQAQTEKKPEQKIVIAPKKVTGTVLGRPVVYSGFLVEMARSEGPLKLVDPRAAGKFSTETPNLYYDIGSRKPKGFVLFAINF
ncbi:MAG: hypothetical protein AB1813_27900 [Verrucomicrobiota bacterium]